MVQHRSNQPLKIKLTYMFGYCAVKWTFKADSCAWQVVRKPLVEVNA